MHLTVPGAVNHLAMIQKRWPSDKVIYSYCRVMGYTVIDFINKLTTAMNNRYNATLFILQQEYIQAYMFTKVLASRIQKQLCLPITRLP